MAPGGPSDAASMKLIDRSPGLFMVACFALVYGFIGIEVVMWLVGSPTLVLVVLGLEVLVAVALVRAVFSFVASEGAPAEHAPRPQAVATPAPRAPGLGARPVTG